MYEICVSECFTPTDIVNTLITRINRTPSKRLYPGACLNLGEQRITRNELYQVIDNIYFYKRGISWYIKGKNCPELFFDTFGMAEEDTVTFDDLTDLYLKMNTYLKI